MDSHTHIYIKLCICHSSCILRKHGQILQYQRAQSLILLCRADPCCPMVPTLASPTILLGPSGTHYLPWLASNRTPPKCLTPYPYFKSLRSGSRMASCQRVTTINTRFWSISTFYQQGILSPQWVPFITTCNQWERWTFYVETTCLLPPLPFLLLEKNLNWLDLPFTNIFWLYKFPCASDASLIIPS